MRIAKLGTQVLAAATLSVWVARPVLAQDGGLSVTIADLDARGRLPGNAAFCAPPESPTRDVNPGVSWSAGPKGTRSYALLVSDPNTPTDPPMMNEPGVVIPDGSPRTSVFHWVMADIPREITAIPSGADSDGIKPGGKPIGPTPYGLRGANVFTTFLAGRKGMSGTYGGYDGPCVPSNDQRLHGYHFHVFALDVPSLGLSGPFSGADLERAVKGHVLAEGEAVGIYSWPNGPYR